LYLLGNQGKKPFADSIPSSFHHKSFSHTARINDYQIKEICLYPGDDPGAYEDLIYGELRLSKAGMRD